MNSKLRQILKKYSTLANVLAGVSASGFGMLMLFVDYLTFWPLLIISALLCLFGIVGYVIKEELEEDE